MFIRIRPRRNRMPEPMKAGERPFTCVVRYD